MQYEFTPSFLQTEDLDLELSSYQSGEHSTVPAFMTGVTIGASPGIRDTWT